MNLIKATSTKKSLPLGFGVTPTKINNKNSGIQDRKRSLSEKICIYSYMYICVHI